MSYRHILAIAAAAAFAPLAHADQAVSPNSLGAAQAVLDYCSRLDPKRDAIFDAEQSRLTRGIEKGDLREIRNSGAYKGAYQEVSNILSSLPPSEGVQQCAAVQVTAPGGPGKGDNDDHGEKRHGHEQDH